MIASAAQCLSAVGKPSSIPKSNSFFEIHPGAQRRAPPLGRGRAGRASKGTVECAQRAIAQVEGDHRDRGPRLHWVGQTALRGVDPVAVEEVREVPMTEPMVDEPTQAVFGRTKLARKPADGQPLAAPAVGV